MVDQDTKNYVNTEIDQAMRFSTAKYGDTPTDIQQLTPKGYVDTQITSVYSAIGTTSSVSAGWFGNGLDGTVTFDGTTTVTGTSLSSKTYTLTRDVYYNSVSVLGTASIKTAQYRFLTSGTLHALSGATFSNNGNSASGNTPGAAIAAGYFVAMPAGVNGGGGGSGASGGGGAGGAGGNGQTAPSVLNALGFAGISTRSLQTPGSILGGNAGASSGGLGGDTGGGGSVVGTNIQLMAPWVTEYLLDISPSGTLVKMNMSAGSGSGPGGGGGANIVTGIGGGGGGGGGSGSNGGIVALYAKNLLLDAGSAITVKGGAGGIGANGIAGSGAAQAGGGAGGNGGSGGNGGLVIFVYNSLTNNATIDYSGGTEGGGGTGAAGANGGGTGGNGLAGFAGNSGSIMAFQITG